MLLPRRQGIEYDGSHYGDYFYNRTNDQAKNFRLMRTDVSNPSADTLETVIPARADVTIEGVDPFEDHIVVYERERGLETICIRDASGAFSHYVVFPNPVYAVGATGNAEYNTNLLRFNYSSLVTPASVFDDDVRTRRELKKQYGLSLLDRGFVFAIAHIRGGAEMGEEWHDQGRLLHKKNTFTDFIACAEHLLAARYTATDRIAIMGGSAGGLLVGAVLNLRPELFHAAIAKVPFVDALNTMLDSTLPLTIAEYEEWGNPEQEEFYRYIRSYSPYDNVAPRDYPAMLVTAGLNDPRVSYWEPAKWGAKLRALKQDSNLLLLKTDLGSGHFGPSDRYEGIKEVAFDYAFLLRAMRLASI